MKGELRKTAQFVFCAVLLIALASGLSGVAGATAVAENGTIEGTVTNESGDPIGGVSVGADNKSTAGSNSTVTASDGTYSLDVPEGEYQVWADKKGYLPNVTDGIEVTAGNTTTQDFVIEKKSYINGTVTDENGESLSNVTVRAESRHTIKEVSTADGNYSIAVPEGTYTVWADADGNLSETVENVSTTKGEVTTQNVSLDPAAVLEGTVTHGNSSVSGATIAIYDGNSDLLKHTGTDSNGSYHADVPNGTYRLDVDADGYAPTSVTDVNATTGETTTQNVTLDEAAIITGTVTDTNGDPIADADVWVHTEDYSVSVRNTTDGNGRYAVEVTNGTYTIDVDADGYTSASITDVNATTGETTTQDIILDEAAIITGTVTDTNGDPIADADVDAHTDDYSVSDRTRTNGTGQYTVEVTNGTYTLDVDADGYAPTTVEDVNATTGNTTTQNATLETAAIVTGMVTDTDGNPVPDADVHVHTDNYSVTDWTRTDQNGRYVAEVANGTYAVEVDADGYAPATIDGVEASSGTSTSRNVTLQAAAVISGTVRDESGNPVPGATIDVHDEGYTTFERVSANDDGSYRVELSNGTYTVEVDADGYAPATIDGVEASSGENTPLEVELGAPAVITGTITDADGNGVAGATVSASNGERSYFNRTSSDGSYEIEVPGGTYQLMAYDNDGGLASGNGSLTVDPNQTETADLRIVSPTVEHASVRHVGGTEPNMTEIDPSAKVFGGAMFLQLTNGSETYRPYELARHGVDETTRFEINVTVTDYDPNTLVWGARNVEWSATPNESIDGATDITIRTNPVNLEVREEQPLPIGLVPTGYDGVDWPTGSDDRATMQRDNTVYVGLFDHSNVPNELARNTKNMTITTNAQAFSRPRITNDSLEIYVAGPHLTTGGQEHDGFYNVFIPQSQLDAWNVSDPREDLTAMYKGSSRSFSVNETEDGAWVELDIAYSDGTVEITSEDPASVSIDATDSPVVEGEELGVTATVETASGGFENRTVRLSIGDDVVDSTNVSLDSGGSTQINLSWATADGDAGEHIANISTGDAADSVTVTVEADETSGGGGGSGGSVQPPAEFSASIVDSNSPVQAGETLDITVAVENVGGQSGTRTLELAIGDESVDSTSVSLDSGERAQVSLSGRPSDGESGNYTATVGGAADDASTAVTFLGSDSSEGDDPVENTTDGESGSEPVDEDGTSEDTNDGDASDEDVADGAGDNESSGEATDETPTDDTTANETNETADDEPASDGTPGFGIAAGLAGMLATLVALRRHSV